MKLVSAGLADDLALKQYFSDLVLPGPIPMKIRRNSSFFDQYRLQSEEFEVLKMVDEAGQIHGLATVILRSARVGEKTERIGYCTDLRISANREALVSWNQQFPVLIQDVISRHGIRWLFSIVPQQDGKGNNALIRPRMQRRGAPQFFLVSSLEAVAILGKSPFSEEPLSNISIREAKESDLDKLSIYLREKTKTRPLSFDYSPEFLKSRLKTWKGLNTHDILLAEDRAGKLIGCVALWDGSQIQQIIPDQYSGFSGTLKTALHVGSWFKLCHRLPPKGLPFELVWMTLAYADNPDIFYSLVAKAYDRTLPGKFLVYTHFPKLPLTLPPKSFFAASLPYGLYAVVQPGDTLPDELKESRLKMPPEIEIPLI